MEPLHLPNFSILESRAEVGKPKSGTALTAFESKTSLPNEEFSQILDPTAESSELTMKMDSGLEIHDWGKSWELKNEERSHSLGPKNC